MSEQKLRADAVGVTRATGLSTGGNAPGAPRGPVWHEETGVPLPSLAEEQAALHRVATLVAEGASPSAVFTAVAEQAGRLVAADIATIDRFDPADMVTVLAVLGAANEAPAIGTQTPTAETGNAARVRATGRPVRVDRYDEQISPTGYLSGFRAAVSVPIIVGGQPWGAMTVASKSERKAFPRGTEERLTYFTELGAIAISNAQARGELEALADEQGALRRVATLVADAAPREDVYAAVAEELARLQEADVVALLRYEADGVATVVGGWGTEGLEVPLGERMVVGGEGVAIAVLRTQRPAYLNHVQGPPGSVAAWLRGLGAQSVIGSPIVVEDELWGLAVAASRRLEALPAGSEARTAEFTELVATAIANSEARAALQHVANEQAALRRVATVVAKAAHPGEVFAAVAEEVGRLDLMADLAFVARYEGDRTIEVVGGWSKDRDVSLVGTSLPLGGRDVSTLVFQRSEPARVDHYEDQAPATVLARQLARSSAGAPIKVAGRLWGVMIVGAAEEDALPDGAEDRLAQFTELIATAIANAQAREELRRVADEQAALRRVATLVAGATPPAELFAAVAAEVGRLVQTDRAFVSRYEIGDAVTILGGWTSGGEALPVHVRFPIQEYSMSNFVRKTGRAVRIDAYPGGRASPVGNRAAVGAPITVEGRLWGLMTVGSISGAPSSPGTEDRLTNFTELVATAIANADTHAELTASRARIVASGDEARRRIVRDLHDGVQQRLVHTIITLKLARRAQEAGDDPSVDRLMGEALDHAEHANTELRDLVHGILPSILTRGGLAAAVAELTAQLRIPVDVNITSDRLAPEIESNAYFVIAEALTNVVKHSAAQGAEVCVQIVDRALTLTVQDDGIGGARPDGSGLRGVADRITALGGTLRIDSPERGGTRLSATLPLQD